MYSLDASLATRARQERLEDGRPRRSRSGRCMTGGTPVLHILSLVVSGCGRSRAFILLKSLGASNPSDRGDVSGPGIGGDGATAFIAATGQSQCPERMLAFGRGTAGNSLRARPGSQRAAVRRGL